MEGISWGVDGVVDNVSIGFNDVGKSTIVFEVVVEVTFTSVRVKALKRLLNLWNILFDIGLFALSFCPVSVECVDTRYAAVISTGGLISTGRFECNRFDLVVGSDDADSGSVFEIVENGWWSISAISGGFRLVALSFGVSVFVFEDLEST